MNGKSQNGIGFSDKDVAYTMDTTGAQAVAFHEDQRTGALYENGHTHALAGPGGKAGQGYQAVRQGMILRKLMPVEYLRLQGMPDDFLDVEPPLSDTAKYRLAANGVARPVGRWVARRLRIVHEGGDPNLPI